VVSPKLAALAAAILFASLAVVQRDLLSPLPDGEPPLHVILQRLARVLGYTSLGIIAVVGLLTDRVFLVKADAFVGIKAALYLPLLIATLAWAVELRASSPRELWSKVRLQVQRLARLFQEPILLWQVVAGLGALAVLAMLWLRSGNDGAAVVSGFELRFRDILDATLPVRPRFKATLFAALMLGMYYCGRKECRWGLPLFLLGVIGVTDYLNTFCHLHIPLLVSVIRDFLGTLIGAALGVVAILVIEARGKRVSHVGDSE
jgi:VanZ family protein